MRAYSFEDLKLLKSSNVSLKLLASDNFAMTLSFFYQLFIQASLISLPAQRVEEALSDHLYSLNEQYPNAFPKSAKEYLKDYVQAGYLRKFYQDEELFYELSADVYKVFDFLDNLQQRDFVGSETKLSVILDLLEQFTLETSTKEEQKIEILQRQIKTLQKKIENIQSRSRRGDERRAKELFLYIKQLSQKLLHDFSQIEENFKILNRKTREKIASGNYSKSKLLDFVFESEESIKKSEEGKSFEAFWKLLRSQESQRFEELIEKAYEQDFISELDEERSLKNFKYELTNRAYRVQILINRLVEQLREFIDQRVWVENRRVIKLIEGIQKKVLTLQELPKEGMDISTGKLLLQLPFGKNLFAVKQKENFQSTIEEPSVTIDTTLFFLKDFIDEKSLEANIQKALLQKSSLTLKELIDICEVKRGIAEIVGYLSLAIDKQKGVVIEDRFETLTIQSAKRSLVVKVPLTIFERKSNGV